jgi:hypothetical protein
MWDYGGLDVLPLWRNWQTRMVQVHVPVRAWGFNSLQRHFENSRPILCRFRESSFVGQCATPVRPGLPGYVGMLLRRDLSFLRQSFDKRLRCTDT